MAAHLVKLNRLGIWIPSREAHTPTPAPGCTGGVLHRSVPFFFFLRYTVGACRVVHLCQAAPPQDLVEDVLQPARTSLISALEGSLGCSVTQEQWEQALLPCGHGGLGLGDPTVICHATQLAALDTAETAVELGLPREAALNEAVAALRAYNEWWGLHARLPPPKGVTTATNAACAGAPTRSPGSRCLSCRTLGLYVHPACMEWLRGPGRWFTLTNDEARSAARVGSWCTIAFMNCTLAPHAAARLKP